MIAICILQLHTVGQLMSGAKKITLTANQPKNVFAQSFLMSMFFAQPNLTMFAHSTIHRLTNTSNK